MPIEWPVHDYSRECGHRHDQYRCTLTEPHRMHQQWCYDMAGSEFGTWKASWTEGDDDA